MDGYERLSDIHKALGHPVRLQILEVLRVEGEACVCHLEAALGQRQAYISQQLMRLRDAGLVIDRRDGLNVFYSLADDAVGALLDAARDAGESLAGEPLAFADPDDLHPAVCSCPKCAEKQAQTAAALSESARG
jgi:DNA-binding transcriptional ArsR family regulator